jgi:hypothetical protein
VRDALVSGLSRDFGVHAYGKWRGAFWRLLSLVDIGVERGHPRALDRLESKRRPDGTWRTEGRSLKRPGSNDRNVEAVDWGDVAHEVLTEQTEGVLHAAGHL